MEEGGGRRERERDRGGRREEGERWRRKEGERRRRKEGGGRGYYSIAFGIAMAVMVGVSSVLGKMKTCLGGFQVHPNCRLHTAESYLNPDDVQH